MDSNRLKRPGLERVRPIRTWQTLFGAPRATSQPAEPSGSDEDATRRERAAAPPLVPSGINPMLADAVEGGYRVINDYMRQAQTAAQGFSPTTGPNPAQPNAPADLQQLSQRVMQYGWDFAGLWFEMWTKMAGGTNGWPSPSAAVPSGSMPTPRAAATHQPSAEPKTNSEGTAFVPLRLSLSVVSARPTTTALEFRPGPAAALVAQPLKAEGLIAPAIEDVRIESAGGGEALMVKVVVDATHPPGVYNGMLVEEASKVPRGTLSVRIYGEGER